MRFLGNKTRMLKNIDNFIEENKINGKTFCDLFAGSGSVSDHYKDRYKIIANDILVSSEIITSAKIKNADCPKFEKFVSKNGMSPFKYLNEKTYKEKEDYFILNNYSPKGGRQFFTEETALRIDGIRNEIEKMKNESEINRDEYEFLIASLIESAMGVSNITGTYEAFLKEWDRRAFKDFKLEPLEIESKELKSKANVVYNEDSNELIESISGDILYLDTPYTITDYSSAYHLLETIAKYDNPSIKGLTGRRVDKPSKSKYSQKNEALAAYEELISKAKFKDIIISYSTQSLIKIDDLIRMLKKYAKDGNVVISYYPYREYKNIRSSQKGDNLREVLIYLKKNITNDPFIKSPLNYSGSKNYIIDQIVEQIPEDIEIFVDSMGGAFNVGINVETEKVIYNEYNQYVFEIVKMLLTEDNDEIIAKVKSIIREHGLEKSNKEKYIEFRNFYNKNKSPLLLFILQMYCFQNQLRFNSKHDFNTPVGNCSCNETTFQRIKEFTPKADKIDILNLDYRDIDISKFNSKTLMYFDPPYIITNATYNDGKRGFNGWDKDQELELLAYLDKLNKKGIKFMLSNVIYHKSKTNETLKSWIEKNNYRVVELVPHMGRYGARKEVLVLNY